MLFRQLFEPVSCTYTYLLGCPTTGECALIDPVIETAERDLAVIRDLGLRLSCTIETHVHADHLTGALKLKHLAGSRIAYPAMDALPCADIGLREGEPLRIGQLALHPLFTPGHTDTHHCYMDGCRCSHLVVLRRYLADRRLRTHRFSVRRSGGVVSQYPRQTVRIAG